MRCLLAVSCWYAETPCLALVNYARCLVQLTFLFNFSYIYLHLRLCFSQSFSLALGRNYLASLMAKMTSISAGRSGLIPFSCGCSSYTSSGCRPRPLSEGPCWLSVGSCVPLCSSIFSTSCGLSVPVSLLDCLHLVEITLLFCMAKIVSISARRRRVMPLVVSLQLASDRSRLWPCSGLNWKRWGRCLVLVPFRCVVVTYFL